MDRRIRRASSFHKAMSQPSRFVDPYIRHGRLTQAPMALASLAISHSVGRFDLALQAGGKNA